MAPLAESQIPAMLLTLAIELPLGLLWLRWRTPALQTVGWHRLSPHGVPTRRALLALLLASTLTHPLAWWCSGQLGHTYYLQGLAIIELAVSLLEALIFAVIMPLAIAEALLLSLFLNLASLLLGTLLWPLLP